MCRVYGYRMTATFWYFTLWFLIILTSCQLTAREVLPTPMPTQVFLSSVSPEHGQRMSYEEYKSRFKGDILEYRLVEPICVYYDAFHIIEFGDSFTMEDYLSRSLLIVNGEVWPHSKKPDHASDSLGLIRWVENGNTVGQTEIGPYDFCWNVELGPGLHTIEFKTRKTSGEELFYRWSFIITE